MKPQPNPRRADVVLARLEHFKRSALLSESDTIMLSGLVRAHEILLNDTGYDITDPDDRARLMISLNNPSRDRPAEEKPDPKPAKAQDDDLPDASAWGAVEDDDEQEAMI